MDLALATIVSCDPKFKLDGAKITNEFWVVHVNIALVKTEDLVRSRKTCNILGNAEKTKIALPSTFVCESCLYHYLHHVNAFCVNNSFCYFLCRFKR